jgi:hypothetical protein
MVVCLQAERGERCVPVCRNCGQDMLPEDRFPPPVGRSAWRQACRCEFPPRPRYPASPNDIATARAFLAGIGAPSSEWTIREMFDGFADGSVKFVFGREPDAEIVVTVEQMAQALGHGF